MSLPSTVADAIDQLRGTSADWQVRIRAMKTLQTAVTATPSLFKPEILRQLKDPFLAQVKELRSAVAREACKTIEVFATALRDQFGASFAMMLPTLGELPGSGNKVIAREVCDTVNEVLKNTHFAKAIPQIVDFTKHRSSTVQESCYRYLLTILTTWERKHLQSQVGILAIAIETGLGAASEATRAGARQCFAAFAQIWPDQALVLRGNCDARTQQLLAIEPPPVVLASPTRSMHESATPTLTPTSSSGGPATPQHFEFSAVSLMKDEPNDIPSAAPAPTIMASLPPPPPSSLARALSGASALPVAPAVAGFRPAPSIAWNETSLVETDEFPLASPIVSTSSGGGVNRSGYLTVSPTTPAAGDSSMLGTLTMTPIAAAPAMTAPRTVFTPAKDESMVAATMAVPAQWTPAVGQRALARLNSRVVRGVIRFVGFASFAQGTWVGLELDTADGKNDGSVGGTVYFSCRPGHGLFVKPSQVFPEEDVGPRLATTSTAVEDSIFEDLRADADDDQDGRDLSLRNLVQDLMATHRLCIDDSLETIRQEMEFMREVEEDAEDTSPEIITHYLQSLQHSVAQRRAQADDLASRLAAYASRLEDIRRRQ